MRGSGRPRAGGGARGGRVPGVVRRQRGQTAEGREQRTGGGGGRQDPSAAVPGADDGGGPGPFHDLRHDGLLDGSGRPVHRLLGGSRCLVRRLLARRGRRTHPLSCRHRDQPQPVQFEPFLRRRRAEGREPLHGREVLRYGFTGAVAVEGRGVHVDAPGQRAVAPVRAVLQPAQQRRELFDVVLSRHRSPVLTLISASQALHIPARQMGWDGSTVAERASGVAPGCRDGRCSWCRTDQGRTDHPPSLRHPTPMHSSTGTSMPKRTRAGALVALAVTGLAVGLAGPAAAAPKAPGFLAAADLPPHPPRPGRRTRSPSAYRRPRSRTPACERCRGTSGPGTATSGPTSTRAPARSPSCYPTPVPPPG